jgi:hypothetical protein
MGTDEAKEIYKHAAAVKSARRAPAQRVERSERLHRVEHDATLLVAMRRHVAHAEHPLDLEENQISY